MPPPGQSASAGERVPEFLRGLSGLKANVEIDRGLDVAMSKDAAHVLVVAGVGPEDQGRRRVPELVRGGAQARRLVDAFGDLAAQGGQAFVVSRYAGKQPWLVGAAQENMEMFIDIVIDQRGELGVEHRFQPDPVLHVIAREDKPTRRSRPARADQVFADPNGAEIAKADREHCEDADGDSKLRETRSLHRCAIAD